jgi:hypothetical protein
MDKGCGAFRRLRMTKRYKGGDDGRRKQKANKHQTNKTGYLFLRGRSPASVFGFFIKPSLRAKRSNPVC